MLCEPETHCPMIGCDGSGHILSSYFTHHRTLSGCPLTFRLENTNNTDQHNSANTSAVTAADSNTASAANNAITPKKMLSPMELKQCPMPRCDSTGNTKPLYAYHRSVSRCPLIRIKIEGLKGILTIRQVDDILAGRAQLPDWPIAPEPTTEDGKQLLEDLIKFTRGSLKKKSASGGRQQQQMHQQSAGGEKNDENRLPRVKTESVAQSVTLVTSNGDAHSRNTRNSGKKVAAAASTRSAREESHGSTKSPRFIPNPPATAASKTVNVFRGGATANKVFHNRNNTKKSAAASSASGGSRPLPSDAAAASRVNYHSQHHNNNNSGGSFRESSEPVQHITFLSQSAAKNKKMMIKKEENDCSITKVSNVKPPNSLIANNNGTAAAAPREMILIGPRKDALKQSFNKSKVIVKKKSSKVIRVNNGNANGSNGTKRKLGEMMGEMTLLNLNSEGLKAKRKANTAINKIQPTIVPRLEPVKPSPPPYSLLNCDLDSYDPNAGQTRHLKHIYKLDVQKVKTLQDTEYALARRLSAAQKGIEVLRPKKAMLAGAMQKSMQDFARICKEIAPLNTEPLSADCTDADTIADAYLQRIALLYEQRDSSPEAASLNNLVKESQLKDFWHETQMNFHRSHRRSQSPVPQCKLPEPSRPQSTLSSSHSQ